MRSGACTDLSPIGERSQAQAAELLNVGKRSVERAREVLDDGTPELVAAVEHSVASVSAAADVATLPKSEQREIVARGRRLGGRRPRRAGQPSSNTLSEAKKAAFAAERPGRQAGVPLLATSSDFVFAAALVHSRMSASRIVDPQPSIAGSPGTGTVSTPAAVGLAILLTQWVSMRISPAWTVERFSWR